MYTYIQALIWCGMVIPTLFWVRTGSYTHFTGIPTDCRMTIPLTKEHHVLTMAHLMMLIW